MQEKLSLPLFGTAAEENAEEARLLMALRRLRSNGRWTSAAIKTQNVAYDSPCVSHFFLCRIRKTTNGIQISIMDTAASATPLNRYEITGNKMSMARITQQLSSENTRRGTRLPDRCYTIVLFSLTSVCAKYNIDNNKIEIIEAPMFPAHLCVSVNRMWLTYPTMRIMAIRLACYMIDTRAQQMRSNGTAGQSFSNSFCTNCGKHEKKLPKTIVSIATITSTTKKLNEVLHYINVLFVLLSCPYANMYNLLITHTHTDIFSLTRNKLKNKSDFWRLFLFTCASIGLAIRCVYGNRAKFGQYGLGIRLERCQWHLRYAIVCV